MAAVTEIRVLVVDDDALVRSALTMLLDGADGIRVAGEAADGDEVPALVDAHAPHVVLMDLRMPRVGGLAYQPSAQAASACSAALAPSRKT